MIRVLLAGGLAGEIAIWSPVVQALAVLSVATVVLVVILAKSDRPAERLTAIIRALRGGPPTSRGSSNRQRPPSSQP